ncbi:heterokaryon incompatibility protein-domain-containing protein [Phaeosphaeriaceae sp. PMI808]|nr:heterokaryon incompatibility protein-domain-containing protein [Phaeosphaeriaceae sp. PMI808]
MTNAPFDPIEPREIPFEVRSALLKYDDGINEDAEAYKYTRLPSDRKRIRLLRLYPGVLKSPQVLCKIFEAEFVGDEPSPRIVSPDGHLTEPVKYEALSWRWGDEDNSPYTIMIRENYQMYKKRVSQTLGLALKYLRRSADRILWIDAICIDQKHKEERSYQVSMMSLVYTHATRVCVWLGEDDKNSQVAFDFIRKDISHLKDFDKLCNDQEYSPKWRAFLGLMQRDWFSRRWVVQEIALATRASVYCGPDELEWRDLAIAVELFVEVETVTHRLSELLSKDHKSRVLKNWFEHISELGASLLVNATARIFREYQRGELTARGPARRSLLSLEYLVTSLSIFDCGRPHDSVYALIAIARDASPNPPAPVKQKRQQALIAQIFGDQLEQKPYELDYNSPYPDVCKDFVQFCIERCSKIDPLQALDILCRPWAKNWQPGIKVDEDQRVRPAKEDMKRRGEDKDWLVSLARAPLTTPLTKHSLRRREKDEDTWNKEEVEIITTLGNDPKLEEIIFVKSKLSVIDAARADREEAEGFQARDSSPHFYTSKDTRRRHPKLGQLGLPSWVAKIDGAPFDIFPHPGMDMVKMGRKNADPLVGTPQDGHRNYSAGQTKGVDLKTLQFKKRANLGHYSLYLKGFCFDRVEKVAQVSQAGAIPASWLDLADWSEARRPSGMNGSLDDPPTAFWKTLVADRGKNDRNPPYYYARACKESILKGGIRSNAVDTTALIYNERNSIIAEFCRRVQSVIWNRALIKTKKGVLGLVSEEVKEGDLICIVYGCTVPVILRRANSKFKTETEQKNEKLEDGIEAMKRLMVHMERYRDRALQHSKLSAEEQAGIRKYTEDFNREHQVKKDPEKAAEQLEEERKELEQKRREKDEREREKETEKKERHRERQRKAKIRDPLRHYTFLDQAYIHGMMDGAAVRQKFYTGKPDHIFEIR